MVRILRLFRALGLLVDTMLSATQVVTWTLLLLMILVYAAGILMVRLSEFADSQDAGTNATPKDRILNSWKKVPGSMWNLMQMVTTSNWADYIREMAFIVGGTEGFAMCMVMCGIMIAGTIGIMNMVVALLCRTAFSLHRRQREMHAATLLGYKKELLPQLRSLLQKHVTESSFGRRVGISTEEFLELYDENPQLRSILKDLDVGKSEILTFGLVFEDDGLLDLEGMYEVIGSIQLELFFKAAESQKFLFGADLLGTLRTEDMLAYNKSLKLLEEVMSEANRNTMGVCTLLGNLNDSLHHIMDDACTQVNWEDRGLTPRSPRRSDRQLAKQDPQAMRSTWDTHLKGVDMEWVEASLTIRLDVVTSVIIIFNAIVMGMQIENKDWNLLWLDSLFTLVFIIEFVLRAIIYTHVRNLYYETAGGDDQESPAVVVEHFKEFRQRLILGIVPPKPPEGWNEVCWNLPSMLKDPMASFDFVIIIICVLDNLTAAILNNASDNFSSVGAFRVIRLLRLSIVLRVFAVFPRLQMLLDAMMWTRSAIFWITFSLFVLVYAFSSTILLVVLDQDGKTSDPQLRQYFGDLYSAMVSGWLLVTFDNWGPIVESVIYDFPGVGILIGVLVGLGGLSAMNIATAVMSEAAVRFSKLYAKKEQVKSLHRFWNQMVELEKVVMERLGAPILSAALIEAATGIKIARRSSWKEDGPQFDPQVNAALREASILCEDPFFIEQLQLIFYEANLQPEFVKLIFERSDSESRGFISIDDFTQGALCTKTDVMKLDILLSNICLRSLRAAVGEVRNKTTRCQQLAGAVLEQACTLIHRRSPPPEDAKDKDSVGHILPERLGKVIDDANAWRDDGVLPFIKGTGTVQVVRGTGKLSFQSGGATLTSAASRRMRDNSGLPSGGSRRGGGNNSESVVDRAKGIGTLFLEEISLGDYLIVEEPLRNQVLCLPVLSIQSNTHLRCVPSAKAARVEDARFMVARRNAKPKGALVSHHHHGQQHNGTYDPHRFEDVTPTVDLHGLLTSSPRTSQAFMTWELETRRQGADQVLKLKKERRVLTLQFEQLVFQIADLHQKDVFGEVIKAWKSLTADAKADRNRGTARMGWMARHYDRPEERIQEPQLWPSEVLLHGGAVLPNPLHDRQGLLMPRAMDTVKPTPSGGLGFPLPIPVPNGSGPRMPHHATSQPMPIMMGEDPDIPDIPREGPRETPRTVGVGPRRAAAPGSPRQRPVPTYPSPQAAPRAKMQARPPRTSTV